MPAGRFVRVIVLVAAAIVFAPQTPRACTSDVDCFLFNPCRKNFHCVLGVCYDEPVVCPSQGPCVLSRCDNIAGCVYEPACPDDSVACNGAEFCIPTPGGPVCQRSSVDCNDTDACTIDFCAEPFGCQHQAFNCNDGDPCTFDTCSPSAGCGHAPVDCCQGPADCPDQACRVDRACVASFCTAGTPRNCDDADPFTLDTCDPATGCVHMSTTPTTIPSGGACDDDADCTADPDPCRVTTCVAGQGCMTRPREGFAAVACVCSRAVPAACLEPLPRAIARPSVRACAVIDRAARATEAKKQARLVGRVGRLMGRARKAALGKPGRALPSGCGESLASTFEDAASRAATFRQGE